MLLTTTVCYQQLQIQSNSQSIFIASTGSNASSFSYFILCDSGSSLTLISSLSSASILLLLPSLCCWIWSATLSINATPSSYSCWAIALAYSASGVISVFSISICCNYIRSRLLRIIVLEIEIIHWTHCNQSNKNAQNLDNRRQRLRQNESPRSTAAAVVLTSCSRVYT